MRLKVKSGEDVRRRVDIGPIRIAETARFFIRKGNVNLGLDADTETLLQEVLTTDQRPNDNVEYISNSFFETMLLAIRATAA